MPRIRATTIAEHKALMRRDLLAAGNTLFAKVGFARTSLSDIAALAGVGRTTVYEYFSSKEDLFLELIETTVPPLVEEVVAGLPAAAAPERLEALFERAFEAVREHPDLALLMFRIGRELPAPARERMWRSLDAGRDEVRSLCARLSDESWIPARCVSDLLLGGLEELAGADDHAAAGPLLATRRRFLRTGLV